MISEISSCVERDGYAFIAEYRPAERSSDLLSDFGEADVLGKAGAVHQLRPAGTEEAAPNSYSGNYGLGAFPLHTDLAQWHRPPRYLLLRCIRGFAEVPTIVVDGGALVGEIGATALTRALLQPRRPVRGKRPLLRLYQPMGEVGNLLRWDEKFIQPATPAGQNGAATFRRHLGCAQRQEVPLLHPGDTIIIDNWRMLHGRAPVSEASRSRLIERAYLRSVH